MALDPEGCVSALELDDGRVLTECAVILQDLARRPPVAEALAFEQP